MYRKIQKEMIARKTQFPLHPLIFYFSADQQKTHEWKPKQLCQKFLRMISIGLKQNFSSGDQFTVLQAQVLQKLPSSNYLL